MRTAATRTPRGSGWLAGVVAILLLAGLVVVTAVAFAPISALPANEGARYAATPGSTERVGLGRAEFPASVENRLLDGTAVALAVPPVVLAGTGPVGPVTTMRWLEEVVSPDMPGGPGAEEVTAQATLRSATDAGLSLHARYGRENVALEPALLELPARVAVGERWSSDGTVTSPQGQGRYANQSFARPGPEGCLVVESTTTLRLATETTRTDVATWCRDRGIVDGTPTLAGLSRQPFTDRWPEPGPVLPADWTGVREELTRRPPVVVRGPAGGTDPWPRIVDSARPAVLSRSGTLFSVGQLSDDIAGHRPAGETLLTRWWGLPAGGVLNLNTTGDIVLATSGDRRLVAYTETGLRLWSTRLSDIAPDGAVGLGSDRVVLSTLSGTLEAYELRTGRRLWRTEVPDGADGRPWVIGDTVYVSRKADAGLAAVDGRTGALRWSNNDLAYELAGVAEDRGVLLAVSRYGTLLRIDARSGASRSSGVAGLGSRPDRLVPGIDDPAVSALRTRDGVLLLDTATGGVLTELPGARDVVAAGEGWWIREDGSVRLLDPRGRELRRLAVSGPVPADARILLGPDRIWLVGSTDSALDVVWVGR
ncbi:hypothetical protein CGZ95_09440 [Enemella evansiae]|uniref:outer membrane protein assembly factor BamB family protein n=1 Tax=Enemella evansiae TaxID=2016499 RepID=UPI000B97A2B2|nr:PQQ-binding-like beta-propeller repeat protein [Enemella evansiae]OYO00827.1 hypothetical protein CGZ95_09440 [Enemella evansiae]